MPPSRVGSVARVRLSQGAIWIVDAQRGDGRRFVVRSDEILSAFVELEREVLTVTFYLESIRSSPMTTGNIDDRARLSSVISETCPKVKQRWSQCEAHCIKLSLNIASLGIAHLPYFEKEVVA